MSHGKQPSLRKINSKQTKIELQGGRDDDIDIDRDCPQPSPVESIFEFDSDISDYDDIHWLEDSRECDVELSSDCFMDALSPLLLDALPIQTNVVRCEADPICLESTPYGLTRLPPGTLSDSEFDLTGSSSSLNSMYRRGTMMRTVGGRASNNRSLPSSQSASSSVFSFPSIRPQYELSPDPTVPSLENNTVDPFASTFSKHRCGLYNAYWISSVSFTSGYHEWSITVKQCGVGMQEIGMISRRDLSEDVVELSQGMAISINSCFGARTVYGTHSRFKDAYYASYDDDNRPRCFRKLSNSKHDQWRNGDTITVCVDMDQHKVKFRKNGKAVRKSMSLQRDISYFPCIAFSGQCRYDIVYGTNRS